MRLKNTRRAIIGDVFIDGTHTGMHGPSLVVVTGTKNEYRFDLANQIADVKRFVMDSNGDTVTFLETTKKWILGRSVGAYLGRVKDLELTQFGMDDLDISNAPIKGGAGPILKK